MESSIVDFVLLARELDHLFRRRTLSHTNPGSYDPTPSWRSADWTDAGDHGKSLVLVRTRDHLDRPGTGTHEDHLLARQPFRYRLVYSGFATIVGRVLGWILFEQIVPTRAQKHRITLAAGSRPIVSGQPGDPPR
jgi:hypothetical protein